MKTMPVKVNETVIKLFLEIAEENNATHVVINYSEVWRNALGFEKKILINGQAVWNGTKITVCNQIIYPHIFRR